MFKSLQARLTFAYLVIIVVCLALTSVSAFFLLQGYQRHLTYARLSDRSALASRLAAESFRRGLSTETAVRRLAQYIGRSQDRPGSVYLLDAEGRVVSGPDRLLEGQKFEGLALDAVPSTAWPMRGERRLALGQRLLYVAEPVRLPEEGGQAVGNYVLLLSEAYRLLRLALADLLPRLIWAGAVALAVSVLVAAVMAYSIARPLDRIAQAAEEIAAGNYDQSLDISAPERWLDWRQASVAWEDG